MVERPAYETPFAERVALADALVAREPDVTREVQRRYVGLHLGDSFERAAKVPLWELTAIAVNAIATWLRTGKNAAAADLVKIDSLGASVAAHQLASSSHDAMGDTDVSRARGRAADPSDEESNDVSVALFIRLSLWWSEATQRVLTEEAQRLGISSEVRDAALSRTVEGCNMSLVRMGARYDAELRSLRRQLTFLALHDSLTGLANRAVFTHRLERALARLERHGGRLAVVFIDLDEFKSINDQFGHEKGDAVLAKLADRLSGEIRAEDLAARLGGDEFVVLLEDLPPLVENEQDLGERFRSALSRPVRVGEHEIVITASFGVAVVDDPSRLAKDVLIRADTAMYTVKRTGRNNVAVVHLGIDADAAWEVGPEADGPPLNQPGLLE